MPEKSSTVGKPHEWHQDHAKQLLDLLLYNDGQPVKFVLNVARACSICRACLLKAKDQMGIVDRTWDFHGSKVEFWHLPPGPEEMPSCLVV